MENKETMKTKSNKRGEYFSYVLLVFAFSLIILGSIQVFSDYNNHKLIKTNCYDSQEGVMLNQVCEEPSGLPELWGGMIVIGVLLLFHWSIFSGMEVFTPIRLK